MERSLEDQMMQFESVLFVVLPYSFMFFNFSAESSFVTKPAYKQGHEADKNKLDLKQT